MNNISIVWEKSSIVDMYKRCIFLRNFLSRDKHLEIDATVLRAFCSGNFPLKYAILLTGKRTSRL